jgi:hypothetical protein
MSIESWTAQYYKRPAKAAATSPLDAVKHSLKKWKGLKAKNRREHDLVVKNHKIYDGDGDSLSIDGSTCALCVLMKRENSFIPDCDNCPITKATGKACCGGDSDDPYNTWTFSGNPKPMIKVLKATRNYLLEQTK